MTNLEQKENVQQNTTNGTVSRFFLDLAQETIFIVNKFSICVHIAIVYNIVRL